MTHEEQVTADDGVQAKIRQHPVLVVCAIIVRDGKVLLERRATTGVSGLDRMWDLPGGKVECGETPKEAIVREIWEEMGVKIVPYLLMPELKTSVWEYDGVRRHWILAAYVCQIESGEPKRGGNLQWFNPKTLNGVIVLKADLEFIRKAQEMCLL